MAIDVSRAAQLRDIDTSFSAIESSDLSALRHPTRPELVAVDAFEVLPDADIWANAYDLFRFQERPGDRPVEVRTSGSVLLIEGWVDADDDAHADPVCRRRTQGWTVRYCARWRRTGTISWRITSRRRTRTQQSSKRSGSRGLPTTLQKTRCVFCVSYLVERAS